MSRSSRCSACSSTRSGSAHRRAVVLGDGRAASSSACVMSYLQPASSRPSDNFYNITRNFSFIGIMALGMTAVIATGGIDLSVGSIMGLIAVCSGLMLEGRLSLVARRSLAGLVRGLRHRPHQRLHHRLCRAVAVRDDARHAVDRALGRGRALRQPHALQVRPRRRRPSRRSAAAQLRSGDPSTLSYPLLFLVVLTLVLAVVYKMTPGAGMCWRSAATSRRRC